MTVSTRPVGKVLVSLSYLTILQTVCTFGSWMHHLLVGLSNSLGGTTWFYIYKDEMNASVIIRIRNLWGNKCQSSNIVGEGCPVDGSVWKEKRQHQRRAGNRGGWSQCVRQQQPIPKRMCCLSGSRWAFWRLAAMLLFQWVWLGSWAAELRSSADPILHSIQV